VIPRGLAVVIDTNVWISGLLTRAGAPAQLTRQVVRSGLPVFSAETYAELQERLWRPKFDRYLTIEQRKALLAALDAVALWIEIPPALAARTFCRDAADDKFIHVALASETAWLVTGDKDLLVLSDEVSALGLHIVTPADALATIQFPSHQ
jgi:uncharacterized protein